MRGNSLIERIKRFCTAVVAYVTEPWHVETLPRQQSDGKSVLARKYVSFGAALGWQRAQWIDDAVAWNRMSAAEQQAELQRRADGRFRDAIHSVEFAAAWIVPQVRSGIFIQFAADNSQAKALFEAIDKGAQQATREGK